MKQKILLTLFALFFSISIQAQIVYLDYDEASTRAQLDPEEVPFIPILGLTHDQYAPLPDGVLLLCCLGGAYLLRKKIQLNNKNDVMKHNKSLMLY